MPLLPKSPWKTWRCTLLLPLHPRALQTSKNEGNSVKAMGIPMPGGNLPSWQSGEPEVKPDLDPTSLFGLVHLGVSNIFPEQIIRVHKGRAEFPEVKQ